MSELLFGYTTSAGTTFKKVKDKNGVTRHFKDGKPVTQQAFAGGQQSFEKPVLSDNGNLPSGIQNASTVQELERLTSIEFTADTFAPVSQNQTNKEKKLRAERNRFLGFWNKNPQWDREKAAKEYLKFRNEVAGVADGKTRSIIRKSYNLGGS